MLRYQIMTLPVLWRFLVRLSLLAIEIHNESEKMGGKGGSHFFFADRLINSNVEDNCTMQGEADIHTDWVSPRDKFLSTG